LFFYLKSKELTVIKYSALLKKVDDYLLQLYVLVLKVKVKNLKIKSLKTPPPRHSSTFVNLILTHDLNRPNQVQSCCFVVVA
jgi:hypothetical protein